MREQDRGRTDADPERILPFLIEYGLPLVLFIVAVIAVLVLT